MSSAAVQLATCTEEMLAAEAAQADLQGQHLEQLARLDKVTARERDRGRGR